MPQALPMIAYYVVSAAGYSGGWAAFAAAVTSVAVASYQKDAARERARAEAYRAARDRTVTIRSGVSPRRYALGTVRLGGTLMYAEFVGPDEEYFDSLLALTHGRIGEFVGVYFDDEFVAVADLVDGVPTVGKYSGGAAQAQRISHVDASPGERNTVTLPAVPSGPDVQAAHNYGTGDASFQTPLTVISVEGAVVTLAETVIGGEIWITYSSRANPEVPMRVLGMVGADDQASSSWSGVATPKWTSQHRLRGVSYVRVLMRRVSNVFQTGLPQVAPVIRGPYGVLDPRTDTTLPHCSNPALLAAWLRTLPRSDGGLGTPAEWIDWDTVCEAADICDELMTVKKLSGGGYETVKRYECNTVISLDQAPMDNLQTILDAMVGDFPFTAGQYRLYAGAFRPATLTITDADVAGDDAIVFAPLVAADMQPPNVVTAKFYSASNNWMETGAPAVTNDAYIGVDGEEEPLELDLVATTDARQANYLMGVEMERRRPGIGGAMSLMGAGANVALLQTVQFNLSGYASMAGKTFEIRRRANQWNGRYPIEFREVRASTYALDADRFVPASIIDPPDLSGLWNPAPVELEQVVDATVMQPDGSTLVRALVNWLAHPSSMVNPGGHIEVRYRAPDTEWTYATPVPGSQLGTYIGPLVVGHVLFIEARARNSLGINSEWSGIDPFTVTGINDVPPDVTGHDWAIKPGQVHIWWDVWNSLRYLETVAHVGASWGTSELLFAGRANDYKHPRPANGTYSVWLRHRNVAGHLSANAVLLEITVDDSIDLVVGSGFLVLTADRFPHFNFPSGTSHISVDPPIVFDVARAGTIGEITWEALAYATDDGTGTAIGPIALTGEGLRRVMTAAAFVAPGSLGSVRSAVVRVSAGALEEEQLVIRTDTTTTAPRLLLSNRAATVPTDEFGLNGDYSGAWTGAGVVEGTSVVTAAWTFTIIADSGLTSTINDGAGPVSGADPVVVSVSSSSIDDGYVRIEATDGVTTLSADFRVLKSKATGLSHQIVFSPRDEINLPTDPTGQVITYADAWTNALVQKQPALDVTHEWVLSIESVNCTATLSGGRINITGFSAMGQLGTTVVTPIDTAGAGWLRPGQMLYAPTTGQFLMLGWNNSAAFSGVATSDDRGATWVVRNVGAAGRWDIGARDDDTWVLAESGVGGTNRLRRSTDGGLTWVAGALPIASQWRDMAASASGVVMITQQSAPTGYVSTDGGLTWSGRTLPGNGGVLFPAGDAWIYKSTVGTTYISTDNGATWTQITAQVGSVWQASASRGRIVLVRDVSSDVIYVRDAGAPHAAWLTARLPGTVFRPSMIEVGGVLYLFEGGKPVHFSVDGGLTWRSGSIPSGSSFAASKSLTGLSIPYLPLFGVASNEIRYAPLLSTSETAGRVTVHADQTGQGRLSRALVVKKDAPVPKRYVGNVNPTVLMLPATKDGVVTDYSGASATVTLVGNGVDESDLWTFNWSATNMTPASGAGRTATFTAMSPAHDTGSLTWSIAKPGETVISDVTIPIRKVKSGVPSGVEGGATYAFSTATATYLAIRIGSNGRVYRKEGTGGSWVEDGQWVGAPSTGVGAAYWVRAQVEYGALDSGTTGTALQLSSDREWAVSNATPGSHQTKVRLTFSHAADMSSGRDSWALLTIDVP